MKPVSTAALVNASQWFAKLSAETVSDQDKRAWQDWMNASPENHQAWQKIEEVNQQFSQITPEIGFATLASPSPARRVALKQVIVISAGGLLGLYAYREQPWQGLLADISTNVGVQARRTLADGTVLHVNTDSLVNIQYTSQLRLIELAKGEIHIETGHDPQKRPFKVKTQHGYVAALGTRFMVRDFESYTEVSLFDGEIKITPQRIPALQTNLHAGQRTRFSEDNIQVIEKTKLTDAAWIKGLLVVYEMPLKQFTQELARYRSGVLRCSDDIAELKISGSFPIKDTNTTLRIIADTLPVRIKTFTRLWTIIEAV